MSESKKLINSNRLLLTSVVILVVSVVYLGLKVNALQDQILSFRSGEITANDQSAPAFTGRMDPLSEKWDPFEEIDRIQKEMNRMFRDSFGRGQDKSGFFTKITPFDLDTDMEENESHYLVTMDIPGMDKENINVEAKNGFLTVSGQRNDLEEKQGSQFSRRERSFGYFSRTVSLPENVDINSVEAEYERGVLKVKIAKKEERDDGKKSEILKIDVQ